MDYASYTRLELGFDMLFYSLSMKKNHYVLDKKKGENFALYSSLL